MDSFLEAFFRIDTDGSEEITVDELERYMRANNFKEEFVQKWLKVFDTNKDGAISLDEYCEALGLIPREARLMRDEFMLQQSAAPLRSLPSDVQVIHSNVTKEREMDIVDLEMEAWKSASSAAEVARQMKGELDRLYESSWHVVVVKGQYWLYCTAVPEGSFHYKRGSYIYLIWRTSA